MTWMRIPIFVWTIEAYAVLLVLALPTISAAAGALLLLDRQAGTSFFEPAEGGSQILWQHMFWFFGHPEVYIMVLPAMGMLSEVIPVFSRKPIFGYKAVAFSTIGIAFASMLVWARRVFTVGLPTWLLAFFLVSSFSVAVPTSIKLFNWLATLWRGHLDLRTPLLFCLGFIGLFTMGGLSGIMLATYPIDFQAQDSYFLVAHLHYVLFGGSVFGIFAGTYYWFPKITGPDVRRAAREGALLAPLGRLQHGLPAAALPRPHGHAAADLHRLKAAGSSSSPTSSRRSGCS